MSYNEGDAALKVLISLSRLLIGLNEHSFIFSHHAATLHWATYAHSIRYLNSNFQFIDAMFWCIHETIEQ